MQRLARDERRGAEERERDRATERTAAGARGDPPSTSATSGGSASEASSLCSKPVAPEITARSVAPQRRAPSSASTPSARAHAAPSASARRSRTGRALSTYGTLSKLCGGGGEVVSHSSVFAEPRVVARARPRRHVCVRSTLKKKKRTPDGHHEGADGRDEVVHLPASALGVRVDAPRHALEPEQVLREERDVDPDEHQPERPLAQGLARACRPNTFGHQ